MSITVRDKDGNVINPEGLVVPKNNPIYTILGEKMSRLNELYANHYTAVAKLLEEQALMLDIDKRGETVNTMKEAARCLNETADRLYEEK